MPTYERSVQVDAPLERVWEFHAATDGLEALTPGWMHLRIESVTGPDGDPEPATLAAGSVIRSSVRPFGIGPRQRWTSRILDRERAGGSASFRDEMVDGPFPEWVHTHSFFADGDETVVRDRVDYELPLGRLGRRLGPLGVLGFEPVFRYRHRRTRELLEAPDP